MWNSFSWDYNSFKSSTKVTPGRPILVILWTVHTYIYTHKCTCTCMQVCACTRVRAYTHTHTHSMDCQVGQNDSRMWNKPQTLKNIYSMLSIQKDYRVQYHNTLHTVLWITLTHTCCINTVNEWICLKIFFIIYNEVH